MIVWLFFGFWSATIGVLGVVAFGLYKFNNNFVHAFKTYEALVLLPAVKARRKAEDATKTINR
jgi:hypothetical protein